ncbi:hypothetical protein SAY87_003861 [Trapa incisa]|uniref:Pentatricopeptide repeat-containing protein n=1 Tax=Trapa incisa TaxID=236973 RepID=A0AAN7KLD9_9MYRT|nr:hypothetical protein SAY87_003861 [Trapa incisa]
MISVATSCGSSRGDESGKEERRHDSSRYPRAVGGIRCRCLVQMKLRIESRHFIYSSTALLDLYMKLGCRANARILFDDMTVRDVVSWNALICGYSRCGHNYRAVELFIRMRREGFAPGSSTLVSLLPSYARPEFFSLGRSVHCLGIKIGTDLDPQVRNVLVSMYGKSGEFSQPDYCLKAWV